MFQQKNQIFTQRQKTYCLEKLIGKGTGGEVYQANSLGHRKNVALKIQTSLEPQERQTLIILNQNQLEHVVNILDLDQYNNQIIIIMELADGSFDEFWKNQKIFDIEEILNYFIQIVQGTLELHKLNLIHRDIKLENVVYMNRDNKKILKLCDTGLMRQQDGRKTIKVGTPYYMAPEQIDQSLYNEKVDIWALGMVLYQMIYKKPMIQGNSIHEVLNNIQRLNQNYIDSRINQLFFQKLEIGNDVKKLLKGMIKQDRIQRISAEDVFLQLKRILKVDEQYQIQNNQNFINDLKEKIRLEISQEYEKQYAQELEKLKDQYRLEIEQTKNYFIETYEQHYRQETLKVQTEYEEKYRNQLDQQLINLDQKYQKEIRNNQLNDQQLNQLKQNYEQEKNNFQKQIEQQFQQKIKEETQKIKIQQENQMKNQLNQQLQNQEQIMKIQLQEQLKKQYQKQFEEKNIQLFEFCTHLKKIQLNLDQNKKNLQIQLQQLSKGQYPNTFQNHNIFIEDCKKQIQQKLIQIETIGEELILLSINSNQQICLQLDQNFQRIIYISKFNQHLINQSFVENFIENQNKKSQEIIKEEQQQVQDKNNQLLRKQQEDFGKQIFSLKVSFSKSKEKLDRLNSDIDILTQKDPGLLAQCQNINIAYNQLNQEFLSISSVLNLFKEKQLKLEQFEQFTKQMIVIQEKLSKLDNQLQILLQKVGEQKEQELQNILNQFNNSIVKIEEWELKITTIIQLQETNLTVELKEIIKELEMQQIALSKFKKQMNQSIEDVKEKKQSEFQKINQELELCLYKVQLLENNYYKFRQRISLKPIIKQQAEEEKEKTLIFLQGDLKALENNINNLQNELLNLRDLIQQNPEFKSISQALEFNLHRLLNLQQINLQQIQASINDFGMMQFQNLNQVKMEESKITAQIDYSTQYLERLFLQRNEIKQQLSDLVENDWQQDQKSLKKLLEGLQQQLLQLQLKKEEQELLKNLEIMKQKLKNTLSDNINECENVMNFNLPSCQFQESPRFKKNPEKAAQAQSLLNQFLKKKQDFYNWANEQNYRIKQIQKQIEDFDNQKMEEFFKQFTNTYEEINTSINELQEKLTNSVQSKSKSSINQFNQLADQFRKKISELQKLRQQNTDQFQNLNFFQNQIQRIKCLAQLFQLYCLHQRQYTNLSKQCNSKYNSNLKQNKDQEELQMNINCIQILGESFQYCLDQQNQEVNRKMLIQSIYKYLQIQNGKKITQYQNDIAEQKLFHEQLENLQQIMKDKIDELRNKITYKNKVKMNCKVQQQQLIQFKPFQEGCIPFMDELKLLKTNNYITMG